MNLVQVPGPKKSLILGVSFTHLVESRDLIFLEAEIVNNIFQSDVLKNVRQIKGYDEMFQAIIKGFHCSKHSQNKNLSQNSCQSILSFFSSNALI